MKLLGDWNWYLPSWLEWLPQISPEGAGLPPVSEEPAQPLERREAPDLLTAGGSLVVGDVERAERVQVAVDVVERGCLLQGGADGIGGDGQGSSFFTGLAFRR